MKEISSNEAWDLLKNNEKAKLVDVRTPEEWDAASVDISSLKKSAFLVTISEDFDSFIHRLEDALPKTSEPTLFFCRSGGRSRNAAELAEKHGYGDSYNVSGGILKWVANALPIKASGDK